MDISQAALARLYVWAFLLGIGLGAVYDVLRITRVFLGVHYSRRAQDRLQKLRLPFLKPHKKRKESRALGLAVFFEDLLFCTFCGVALILLFYQANHGKFRFPAVLAAGAGFLLYRATVGRVVMLFSEVIAFLIETAVRYLVFFVTWPFRHMARWIRERARRAYVHRVSAKRRQQRKRYTEKEVRRAPVNGCGMVPPVSAVPRKIKRGKCVAKGKKTIQSDAAHARTARRSGAGVDRSVRQ